MAVCFVVSQLIAVEIPMLIFVLSELRVSLATLAARIAGVVAAALVMAATCLLGRLALISLGIGPSARAAVTIALGLLVYALALSWLAPDISVGGSTSDEGSSGRSAPAGGTGSPALTTR